MIKTESFVNVAVIGIAALLLLAATPVRAANPSGLVGTHANAAHDGDDRIYSGSEPGPAYYGNFGFAPEGLNPAFDPWGRARGPNDTNAPGCQLRSCD